MRATITRIAAITLALLALSAVVWAEDAKAPTTNGFRLPESMWHVKPGPIAPGKSASRAYDYNAPTFSWEGEGIMTTVKSQGGTGACWIFADIAQLEARVNNKPLIPSGAPALPNYSEQDVANYYPLENFLNGGNAFMTASYFMQNGVANDGPLAWLGYRMPWEPNLPRFVNLDHWHYYGNLSGNPSTSQADINGIKALLADGPVFSAMSVNVATNWDANWAIWWFRATSLPSRKNWTTAC